MEMDVVERVERFLYCSRKSKPLWKG